ARDRLQPAQSKPRGRLHRADRAHTARQRAGSRLTHVMFRAIWLTVQNEARLLLKDPIVLFMLLLAPVVIIAVAGYSLGNLYGGGTNGFLVPIVDRDRGEV